MVEAFGIHQALMGIQSVAVTIRLASMGQLLVENSFYVVDVVEEHCRFRQAAHSSLQITSPT